MHILTEKIGEKWKAVPGYTGAYEVSNLGRVKSLPRSSTSGGLVAVSIAHRGYPRVCLCMSNKMKHINIHRLVAQAFLPNPTNLPQVNHKNGVKTDNRVENLEWCDNKYNMKHAREVLGFSTSGANSACAKLTEREVNFLRWMKLHYPSIESKIIANFYGVTTKTITNAWAFTTYKPLKSKGVKIDGL
jgi:hypothetical protein